MSSLSARSITSTDSAPAYTREYGSWVMFTLAYITGSLKAGRAGVLAVVVFASLLMLLLAKAPLVNFLRTSNRRALKFVLLYSMPAGSGLVYSVLSRPQLIILYLAGLSLFSIYYFADIRGRRLLAESIGMAVISLSASVAASLGGDLERGLLLGGLFFLFYFSSTLRVRLARREFRLASTLYCGLVLLSGILLAIMGNPAFVAFLPLLEDLYSALRYRRERFSRIGLIESVKTAVFCALVLTFFP